MDKSNVVYPYVEYNLVFKRNEVLTPTATVDEPWEHYGQWKKPDPKSQIPYDHIHRKFSEYWIHRDRKKNGGCQGMEE